MFLLSDDHTLLPPAPPGDYFFLEKEGGGVAFFVLMLCLLQVRGYLSRRNLVRSPPWFIVCYGGMMHAFLLSV